MTTESRLELGLTWTPPDSPTAAMVLDHDWAASPLGPIEQWPISLRAAVSTCLGSRFPLLVLWGPELIKIYNDGYAAMLGSAKHPRALGRPAAEIWPEIWDVIGPMFESVLTTGTATWSEHQMLLIDRSGFPEECYFTFSYSPLFDDDGAISGVLDIAVETTAEILGQRRLGCIADLNASVAAIEYPTDACVAAIGAFSRHSHDIVGADVLLAVDDRLVRVASNRRAALGADTQVAAEQVLAAGRGMVVGQGEAGRPSEHYLVPLASSGGGRGGVLVASLSPVRPFDAEYREFVDVVAQTLGNVVDRAQHRAAALGELQLVNDTLQRAMLPSVTDSDTVAARYLPATDHLAVGGDWYDIVDLPGERSAIVVGDCVGHGLDAATVMAQLRSATRALLLEGRDPASTVVALDAFADSIPGGACASVVCAVVDQAARTLTYCRAGHPPAIVVGPDRAERLGAAGGPVLGVDLDATRTNSVVAFGPTDVAVLYTDGLIERRDRPADELVAELESVVGDLRDEPVGRIADGILARLVSPATFDDVVVLVKRVDPVESASRAG